MSKTTKRVLGCIAILVLFCLVSIPVGYIVLMDLDNDLEETKQGIEETLEAESIVTQQALATNQKAHQNAVDTQTAR